MTSKLFAPVLAALALAVGAPAALAAPVTRYVAPDGTGSACTQAEPCSIDTAFASVHDGGEIVFGGGDYGSADHPLTGQYTEDHGPLYIHGEPGAVPHLHVKNDGGAIVLFYPESRVSWVDVDFDGPTAPALWGDMDSVDHVRINSTGAGISLNNNSGSQVTVSNTLIHATGESEYGLSLNDVQAQPVTPKTVTLSSVTAVADGPNSSGFSIEAAGVLGATVSTTVQLHNTILRGTTQDIYAVASGAGDSVSVAADHSNWVTYTAPGAGMATMTANDSAGNQSSAPLFADAANGDFRQLAGSPTIDAGAAEANSGSLDIDGDARVLGSAIDIGADEFVPPPVVDQGNGSGPGDPAPAPDPSGDPQPNVTPTRPVTQPPVTPARRACIVPKLVGKSLKAARSALAKANCAVGKVTKARSPKKVGKVVKQATKPGKHLAQNAKIGLVLGRR